MVAIVPTTTTETVRIGAAMKAARKRARYTLVEVQNLTGITPSALSRIERGEYGCRLTRAAVLAELYGVDLSTLVGARKERAPTRGEESAPVEDRVMPVPPSHHTTEGRPNPSGPAPQAPLAARAARGAALSGRRSR